MKKKPNRLNKASKTVRPSAPKDTPATRKKRLQQRLREMSVQNEREMSALMKSVDRIKSTFRSKKSSNKTSNS